MLLTRSVAILVVVFTLLGLAGRAGARVSRLTPTPPVTLSAPTPSPTPAPTQTSGSTTQTGSGLPRTGNDIPRELLFAAALVGAGGILRLRWSTNRS